jgi:hypothetical protein
MRGETLSLFDALLDIGYIEDISFVEGKEILPVERSTILGKTNGANIADLKKETKLFGEKILFRDNNIARGEATSHERLIHRMDEFIDIAERQFLIHIGTSNTFEEVNPLHSVLNSDIRNVESDVFICGKINRRGEGRKVPPHAPH